MGLGLQLVLRSIFITLGLSPFLFSFFFLTSHYHVKSNLRNPEILPFSIIRGCCPNVRLSNNINVSNSYSYFVQGLVWSFIY